MSPEDNKKVLTNFLVIAWIVLVGYLIFHHLTRVDFRDELKILWRLQQVVNSDELAKSLPSYLDAKKYLNNINNAINDPSLELIDPNLTTSILDDLTLSEWEKCRQIVKNKLDIIIKLNYGTCEAGQNYFTMEVRDKCHGDFNLSVKYTGTYDDWKITELLLYKRMN